MRCMCEHLSCNMPVVVQRNQLASGKYAAAARLLAITSVEFTRSVVSTGLPHSAKLTPCRSLWLISQLRLADASDIWSAVLMLRCLLSDVMTKHQTSKLGTSSSKQGSMLPPKVSCVRMSKTTLCATRDKVVGDRR